MRILRNIIGFGLFCSIVWAFPASAVEEYRLRVVVIGDALSGGYKLRAAETFPARLQEKLRETGFKDVQVTGVGEALDSSTEAAARMSSLLALNPDVVVIAVGLNDIVAEVNPNVIHHNAGLIAAQLNEKRIYTVLLGIGAPENNGKDYARQLESIYRNLATIYKLPFYPDALAGISGNPKYTLADDIRPNAGGVDIIVEGMYRLVDYGLRWRLNVLQYQDQYRQQQAQ